MVTAADIKVDHNVEVLNGEQIICNLTKDTAINMRLKVERGFGYQPAASRRRPDEETRAIGRGLDASFSPVRRVAYAVEAARVEQRTDLDKLVIDIETNGTIDAEEAVRTAADILSDQLSVFGDFTHRDRGAAKPANNGVDPVLLRPIDDRADRPFGQLPEGRKHLLHRRSDPEDRSGAAQDPEPRQEVADRDQGSAGPAWPVARHEAGELAAGRRLRPRHAGLSKPCFPAWVTMRGTQHAVPAPMA